MSKITSSSTRKYISRSSTSGSTTMNRVSWGADTITVAEGEEVSNVINEVKRLNPYLVNPYILDINEELFGTNT